MQFNSEPSGASVTNAATGGVICNQTPCVVKVRRSYSPLEVKFQKPNYEAKEVKVNSTFKGYGAGVGDIVLLGGIGLLVDGVTASWMSYPKRVSGYLEKETYVEDPTIRVGEATNRVTRDKPGQTALERTIIRWNFDSEPRGSRIFWRVISSIPDEVKNTNESYLTTTPYEETRSFNILGLTYENSRDVTIEIKVSKNGYYDQVKRYNVRQAIDQQEISGFFELVKKEGEN